MSEQEVKYTILSALLFSRRYFDQINFVKIFNSLKPNGLSVDNMQPLIGFRFFPRA